MSGTLIAGEPYQRNLEVLLQVESNLMALHQNTPRVVANSCDCRGEGWRELPCEKDVIKFASTSITRASYGYLIKPKIYRQT